MSLDAYAADSIADSRTGNTNRRFDTFTWFILAAASLPVARVLIFPAERQLTVEQLAFMVRKSTLCAIFAFLAICVFALAKRRSVTGLVEYLSREVLSPRNIVFSVTGMAAIAMFSNSFAIFKETIPAVNPYSLDPLFAKLDGMLHFGWQPWELTSAVLGYGSATVFLDSVYYVWFLVIFASVATAVMVPGDNMLRDRFLLAYMFSWLIIGVGMAHALSSVGPIFYDLLEGGPSPFSGMIAQLDQINASTPITTVMVRDRLWANYLAPDGGVISGISAMPSMHNALCVLLILTTRHIGTVLFAGAIVFASVIFVGSVHLGWHYAIDAYVSAAVVGLIWIASGYLVGMRGGRRTQAG